jgi:hypothetical protein
MVRTPDWRSVLSKRWRSTASGPFFDIAEPPAEFIKRLPEEYLAAVQEFGSREGFLGEEYLRLYRLEELVDLNLAYEVQTHFPEATIFGSNGLGEGFAFRVGRPGVIQVPFVPLASEYLDSQGNTFADFVHSLAETGESSAYNPKTVGIEVHDIHPICLGGSPTDSANKALIPVAKHAEVCRFWNKAFRAVLARQRTSG